MRTGDVYRAAFVALGSVYRKDMDLAIFIEFPGHRGSKFEVSTVLPWVSYRKIIYKLMLADCCGLLLVVFRSVGNVEITSHFCAWCYDSRIVRDVVWRSGSNPHPQSKTRNGE